MKLIINYFSIITMILGTQTYAGGMADRKLWSESNNHFMIEIESINKGTFFTDELSSTITAAKCQVIGDKCKEIWKIKDFSTHVYESVIYVSSSLKLIDLNDDNKQDSVFFYSISKDGLDPDILKGMFHIDDKKYAIRGTIPKHIDNISDFEYKFDKSFKSLDIKVVLKCKELWDSYVNSIFLKNIN